MVASDKPQGAVRVSPAGERFQERLVFSVVALNKADQPTNLGYENVRATTGLGAPLQLITYAQLTKEAETAAAWQAFAVALSASASAYSASQPATATTYGSSYGSGGYRTYSARTTVYDPAAAQMAHQAAQANANQSYAAISDRLEDRLSSLSGDILRTTTIDPGETDGGQVVAAVPRFAKGEVPEIRVFVTLNGEEHEFRYNLSATK